MKRSRSVLAIIDAAMISGTRVSPLTTAVHRTASGRRKRPSISTSSGCTSRARRARHMASSDARWMLMRSISSAQHQPVAQAVACSRMVAAAAARSSAVSCLESFRQATGNRGGSTTAAAVTGPARGPRPASSIPQRSADTRPAYRCTAAGHRRPAHRRTAGRRREGGEGAMPLTARRCRWYSRRRTGRWPSSNESSCSASNRFLSGPS